MDSVELIKRQEALREKSLQDQYTLMGLQQKKQDDDVYMEALRSQSKANFESLKQAVAMLNTAR